MERRDRLNDLTVRADLILGAAKKLADEWYGDQADKVPLISVQIAAAMMNMDGADRLEDRLELLSQSIREKE